MGAAALIIMLSAIQFSLVLLRNIAVVVMRLTSAIALPLVRSQLEHHGKGVKQPGPNDYGGIKLCSSTSCENGHID